MSTDDLMHLLETLGVTTVGVRGSEVQGYCPGHVRRTGHADRNPSWYINADSLLHICFSCGFKGSLQFLIATIKGTPIESAEEWMKSSLGLRLEAALTPKKEVKKDYVAITEANLSAFVEVPNAYLRARGLMAAAAKDYGILFDEVSQAWILPIREPINNKLLGWQEKGVVGRYFRNYPKGVEKSRALFGYHLVKENPKQVIVVESPLDAVRLMSVGVHGGVSTYGSIISNEQLNLIRGAEKIIFAMDNDEAGRKSSEDLLEKSKSLGFECFFFNYRHTDQKDVGGMSRDEILTGLENAKHSLHGRRALV
jgi:DNA primase